MGKKDGLDTLLLFFFDSSFLKEFSFSMRLEAFVFLSMAAVWGRSKANIPIFFFPFPTVGSVFVDLHTRHLSGSVSSNRSTLVLFPVCYDVRGRIY